MTNLTIFDKIRLVIAAGAGLIGAFGFVLGGASLAYAWLTGHRDPVHGGAMLAAAGGPVFLAGVVLLVFAVVLWPWRRRSAGPAV
jgi:hypothetical protein